MAEEFSSMFCESGHSTMFFVKMSQKEVDMLSHIVTDNIITRITLLVVTTNVWLSDYTAVT